VSVCNVQHSATILTNNVDCYIARYATAPYTASYPELCVQLYVCVRMPLLMRLYGRPPLYPENEKYSMKIRHIACSTLVLFVLMTTAGYTDSALAGAQNTVVASYYAHKFHGRTMANGKSFNMHAMTVAHKTLPFGTKLRLTNPKNGRVVVVTVTDRGPFTKGRTLDVSLAAAQKLGFVKAGVARLRMERQ